MEDDTELSVGIPKRQLVLYAIIGACGAVFFSLLLWPAAEPMSDTATIATSTVPLTQSAATTTSAGNSGDNEEASSAGFRFEVVATPALRQHGLSGRTEVPQNYGMLFVFPDKELQSFWMKDMRVPIDIIWLSDTGSGVGTIVGIEEAVSPSTYPTIFSAPVPVRYVLEVAAGEARRQGWDIGTTISLPSGITVSE